MSYRFKASDAKVSEGLRRIAAEECALIAAALADRALPIDRKVHEGRKGTKRLRALVRLVGPAFPDARAEIAALRSAAGQLSALRDKDALTETLLSLELASEPAANLTAALTRRRAMPIREQKRLLAEFGAAMEAVAARAGTWTLDSDGWDALAPGLERSYRRLVRALAAAKGARNEEALHDWRKRAKDHWYHTLLLRGVFPEVMGGYAAAAEQLCDDLGDWRDLGLLETAVDAVPAHLLAKPDSEAALATIAKARRRALRRAFRTARRLTCETADAYTARLKAWWAASR